MTLDDAINYYDGIAKEYRANANIERNDYMDLRDGAFEAEQLASWLNELRLLRERIEKQPEPCEYYALCRHGRDENKLRSALGRCDYCNEDSDGYVKPIERNGHAFIRFGMNGWELELKANGWHGSAKIRYCPMCGRRLKK